MRFLRFQLLWIRLIIILFAGVAVLAIGGCRSAEGSEQADLPGQETVAPNSDSTPVVQATRLPTSTPVLASAPKSEPMTLVMWIVEDVLPLTEEQQPNPLFEDTIRDFERTNPDISVNVLVKKNSGKGGVLDFLRTSKEVAPSVLPDVAIMNAADLNQAYADNLILNLDGKLDRSIVQDLLPAARRMGTVDDKLVGGPLGLEMEHTVYNTGIFSGTPMVWTDVLSTGTKYLFPAKGVNGLVNDVTLSQYFSAGGELVNDEGHPEINEQVLRDILFFYENARATGRIDGAILETSTTEELWPAYMAGQAGLAQISVRQYLTDRELLHSTQVSALPVQNKANTPVGIMHSWALVLVTEEIGRQDAALRLMETFLSTENNAKWNAINKSIPVRDTAYQQLAGDDPYWQDFLFKQLNNARPEPAFPGYDRVGRILQQSVEQVIRGEATAEEATSTAIDALSPR